MSSCHSVLRFQLLLSLGNVVDYVLGSRFDCLIRILRSLGLCLGLEVALVLVVGLPSLLEWQVWAWMRILMALQELW